ncbi:MAG TPA: putative ABC exporter domain-containing protein [Caproicibacter sp.]|nr:putative ABC exporter domain-containing protein [Caproicibacter sp.]
MSALAFLVRKQVKNFFRELIHHPSKLIAYLFTLGLLVFMFVSTQMDPPKKAEFADIRMLHGIFLGWLLLLSVPTLLISLKSGTTMFKMSDVNFLFVSPLSPKHILAYGLTKQMAATLLGFIFMLFYSGMLMEHFKVSPLGVLWLLLGSALTVFVIQVISLLIYSFANGNPKRQNIVRAVMYLYLGGMVVAALYIFQKNGGGVNAIYNAVASPVLEYFPIIGWMKGAVFALIAGKMQPALIYAVLLLAAFVACLITFEKSDTDYYEDVLKNTETQFEARQALKEKRTMTVQSSSKKVKVGKTGIGKGWGANAFFYKHLCEARRRSRLIFISVSTVLTLAADLILSFIITFSSRGDKDAPTADLLLVIALACDVYILFMLNAAGDWSRELGKPYVYLVPEDPFRKLLWASMTSVLKPVVDGAAIFLVLTLAMRANPLSGVICFLGYASFGFIFTAGNILAQRTMGGMGNRGLIAILYMMMLAIIIAPGIIFSVILYFAVQSSPAFILMFLVGLPTVAWNILASLVIVFCCRNLLSTAEMD